MKGTEGYRVAYFGPGSNRQCPTGEPSGRRGWCPESKGGGRRFEPSTPTKTGLMRVGEMVNGPRGGE